MTNPEIQTLAKHFADLLHQQIGDVDFAERQKLNDGHDGEWCHSHNYCDPNEVMTNALIEYDIEICMTDVMFNHVNNIWAEARRTNFERSS